MRVCKEREETDPGLALFGKLRKLGFAFEASKDRSNNCPATEQLHWMQGQHSWGWMNSQHHCIPPPLQLFNIYTHTLELYI